MLVCQNIKQLRQHTAVWRNNSARIAFVPTMGNLHAGHLSLVDIAQRNADHVIVSIYVNPMQFLPSEDFASYPRTLEADLEKLRNKGVDLVFTPDSTMVYPNGEQHSAFVEVPELSNILEGEYRPGFFKGVCTVVLKLFNMVQPDCAIFGEKDFQQLLVIRRMVSDLNIPVEIIAGELVREADGLAMSSRNNYLDAAHRKTSRLLSQTLQSCRQRIEHGASIDEAEQNAVAELQQAGFTVDYVTFREPEKLGKFPLTDIPAGTEMIVLAAAKIGNTRLIDNVKFVKTC